jgi:hypothetical protein
MPHTPNDFEMKTLSELVYLDSHSLSAAAAVRRIRCEGK